MSINTPTRLRCEYRTNPMGIDVLKPRLSWELTPLQPDQRGTKQTAYRVLVSSRKDWLEKEQGDLWDSGKALSQQTSQIEYQGSLLTSRMECWWRVQCWDQHDQPSPWSNPAHWSMGLIEAEDWKAEWIEEAVRTSFERCRWISISDQLNENQEKIYFRCSIPPASLESIQEAKLLLASTHPFTLYLNQQEIISSIGEESRWKKVFVLDVMDRWAAGENQIALEVFTHSSEIPAITGKLIIRSKQQKQSVVIIDNSWEVATEGDDHWMESKGVQGQWTNAHELGPVGSLTVEWGVPGTTDDLILSPPAYFRNTFSVQKRIQKAVLYATAMGIYELHLNGKRVGDHYFAPGWSDYRKRIYYQTYDVSSLINDGNNTLGAILADGWYAGYVSFQKIRNRYNGDPKLRIQLHLDYEDGSNEIIKTDASWTTTHGPIQEADLLMGETYDANQELPEWSTPHSDNSNWNPVYLSEEPEFRLEASPGDPVRKIETLSAHSVSESKPGVHIFDLGQNIVGWVQLKVKGRKGDRVGLRFGEALDTDGTLYTENLRIARAQDTYILKGETEGETWEPRFTFHGFRYVEVTGYPSTPSLDAITGIVLHTQLDRTGFFECSDPLVSQLFKNIVWSQRGNHLEIPTDCPQRDERLGWSGDAQVFMRTGAYNMDIAAFFTKWLIDLQDSQNDQGTYGHVAPDLPGMGHGSPGWADAGIICPYLLYQYYRDTRILELHYESMVRYIDYLKANSKKLIRPSIGYGDWVSQDSNTPKELIATAYFAFVCKLMSEMANVLGKMKDQKKYEHLYEKVKTAYLKAFVNEEGQVKGGTQTAYCVSLEMDLIPPSLQEKTGKFLVKEIMARNGHLSTGFLGIRELLPALSKINRHDVAYKILLNDTFPSWGYQIQQGATTTWEHWDGWTEEFGFQSPQMNSFNHYAFGAVGEWLFSTMAGIEGTSPGFKHITIRPHPGGNITWVRSSYHSIHGRIESNWRVEKNNFHLQIRIPLNTTATVHLPALSTERVTECGRPLDKSEGVQFKKFEDDVVIVEVESGYYEFLSKGLE